MKKNKKYKMNLKVWAIFILVSGFICMLLGEGTSLFILSLLFSGMLLYLDHE